MAIRDGNSGAMMGRQVPTALLAGVVLLVCINLLMDRGAPATRAVAASAQQQPVGSNEMLTRIRRDLAAQ